ncbi:MAG: hypothetical protein ABI678_28250 [Kofleriaceae bacterium]
MRLVAVALGVLLFGATAHAQAFKPRGGAKAAPAKADKKSGKTKASAAKAAPAADSDDEDSGEKPAKKKAAAKGHVAKKGSRAAREGRPDDLTPGPAGKHDPDFVLITDDDDIE